MINSFAAILHGKLMGAGIPIDGVSFHREMGYRIDFRTEATAEQRAQAQQMVATFDPNEVQPETERNTVTIDDINDAKTVADLKALLIKMLAE